ncbi:hypothetical protein DENSPDRAFT_404289 [Dentipellis sp. KUC8613]|nr:hypothetical protein DENSPDRAFT_404289 [Dentipellis sp. KUC8613]
MRPAQRTTRLGKSHRVSHAWRTKDRIGKLEVRSMKHEYEAIREDVRTLPASGPAWDIGNSVSLGRVSFHNMADPDAPAMVTAANWSLKCLCQAHVDAAIRSRTRRSHLICDNASAINASRSGWDPGLLQCPSVCPDPEPVIYARVTRSAHARDIIGWQTLSNAACGTMHGAAESSGRAATDARTAPEFVRDTWLPANSRHRICEFGSRAYVGTRIR